MSGEPAEQKPKNRAPTWQMDERRTKIRELVKERIDSADYLLKEKMKKTGIEGRLEKSDETLQDLIEFGDELIANIKVAGEIREIARRDFEDARKAALMEDLSKESTQAIAQFNNITDRWSELKEFKEPVAMFNQLEKQKNRIAEVMEGKDKIIAQCQAEVDRVSDRFYADQERQAAEIASLVERIDNQVELIKKAYKAHIELLEEAIEEERLNLAQTGTMNWETLFATLKHNEKRKLEIEKEKEKFYVEEIDKLFREQEELTRATRIRLGQDAEALQVEMRCTQNNILMNSEKLDYNYQVLQKRNEENVIINNQQKRRVAKFKETISALKTKINSIKAKADVAVKKMSVEVEKLYANISELEKKSQQFLCANEKQYRYVWNISYQEALSMVNKIFEIDHLLYQQQLGIPWVPQHVKGLYHNPVDNTTTGVPLMSLDIKTPDQEEEIAKRKAAAAARKKSVSEQLSDARLLRSILKRISDRAGFLIEEKLLDILNPYTDEQKCLVRVDSIFQALKITESNDISSLTEYFLPYSWCPNCSSGLFPDVVDQLCEKVEEHFPARGRSSLEEELEKIVEESDASSSSDSCSVSTDEVDKNINHILTDRNKSKQDDTGNDKNKCVDHFLVIKPAFVLTALRNFTEIYLKGSPGTRLGSFEKAIVRHSRVPRPVQKESVEKFWGNLLNVMPPEKQKLWHTLQHGLDHYLEVLKEREALDAECEFLRRQNSELRHLLQKLIPTD